MIGTAAATALTLFVHSSLNLQEPSSLADQVAYDQAITVSAGDDVADNESDLGADASPVNLAEVEEIEIGSALSTSVTAPVAPTKIVLPSDTPVHLMVISEVTTKTHSVGHRFKLRVNEPVIVDGVEVVPVGATAWGHVTSATSSGNVGKSGRLAAELLYLEVGDQNVAIDGQTSDKGKSGTAETVMGVIGLGVFGLFAKGNNAKIKAGEKMTAFTVEDVEIELVKGEQ